MTKRVDWEVELAVVIGKTARDVEPAQALDYVFGYSVANDVSARDVQAADGQLDPRQEPRQLLPTGACGRHFRRGARPSVAPTDDARQRRGDAAFVERLR